MSEKEKPDALVLRAEEIESLNVDNLDIEELERRIELAGTLPFAADCYVNSGLFGGAEDSSLIATSCGTFTGPCTTFNGSCTSYG